MLVAVHFSGVSLNAFGIVFALAFLACGLLIARRLRGLGKPVDWAYEMVFAALVGGVVGSRVYFIAQNGTGGGLTNTLFSGSGLIWYGGVVGRALPVAPWAWDRRVLRAGPPRRPAPLPPLRLPARRGRRPRPPP